jgi:hypothetical protein
MKDTREAKDSVGEVLEAGTGSLRCIPATTRQDGLHLGINTLVSALDRESATISGTFFFILLNGVRVSWYCGHYWPIVPPQMLCDGVCGEIGGMNIGRGNPSTRRKPAPAPLFFKFDL